MSNTYGPGEAFASERSEANFTMAVEALLRFGYAPCPSPGAAEQVIRSIAAFIARDNADRLAAIRDEKH